MNRAEWQMIRNDFVFRVYRIRTHNFALYCDIAPILVGVLNQLQNICMEAK